MEEGKERGDVSGRKKLGRISLSELCVRALHLD